MIQETDFIYTSPIAEMPVRDLVHPTCNSLTCSKLGKYACNVRLRRADGYSSYNQEQDKKPNDAVW